MANRIQLRRGGSQEWRNANPVLAQGEIGIDLDSGRIKIGDGTTAWNSLAYERPVESVANTANSLVQRDADGNFAAGVVTATLIGNASTASRLTNIRQFQLTQDVIASGVFDGSSNLNLAAQLQTISTLPHYDGTTSSQGTYTKLVVDAKGRIINASSPTTIQAYGLDTQIEGTGAQPFDNDLRAVSQLTTTGIAIRGGDGQWTTRSILSTAGQIVITNGSGTGGNPQVDLATTTVVNGNYNTESLTSVNAVGPLGEPFGTQTVNTVKYTVDNRGRLQSSTNVPIATATEGSKYPGYDAGTAYARYDIIETGNNVYQAIRAIAAGGGAPAHTSSSDTGGWRYLAAAAIEQKGLASFAQEDFDVDSNGHVTIAALGVDNTQLQNNRISFADGTTKEDFELDQELTATTGYRGFNYLNYVKVNDTSGSLLFTANNTANSGAGGVDINVDTNISGANIILDRPGTSPLQTIERTAGDLRIHHNVSSTVNRTLDIISNNAGTGNATINITADNDVVITSTTGTNYVKVEDIWVRANTITSNNSTIIIDPVTEGDNTGTVQIKGNLQIDGITTTVNSTTVTIDDPIITLGGDTVPTVDDNKDRGVEFNYYDTQARLGFFGWDDSYATLAGTTGGYRFLYNATNTSEVFSGTDAGVIAGNLALTSNVDSSSATTGTLVVTGGVGISQQLRVGGNATISGNTSISGTLTTTLDSTFNRSVTIVGSDTAATELFKIQNGSAVDKFTVDSATGNTIIEGTLGTTGNTSITGTLAVTSSTTLTGATTLSSTLGVTGATTLTGNLTTQSASTVNIQNTANSNVTGAIAGTAYASLGTYGALKVDGGASIANSLVVGGSFKVYGQFDVDGAVSYSGNTIFKGNVSIDNDGVTPFKFNVASSTGRLDTIGQIVTTNATDSTSTTTGAVIVTGGVGIGAQLRVGGNATITGNLVANGSTTIGDAAADALTVNATSTFNAPVTVSSSQATSLGGTLTVTDLTTLNKGLTLQGSTTAANEFFRITDGAGTPVTKFLVDSATGNTTIAGSVSVTGATTLSSTLSVTDDVTLNKNVTIVGSNTAATELFKIQNASAVDKFTVDSSSGNTTIAGTATITSATQINSTLGVTGVTSITNATGQTLTGAYSADGAVRVTGGAAIGQNLAVSGNMRVFGDSTISGATTQTGNAAFIGRVSISNTDDVTSFADPEVSLSTTGGFRATRNAYIGGDFYIWDNTNSRVAFGVTNSTGAVSTHGNLTVGGNLIVNGTTTTVNSTTITVDDPIITLGGDTAPTSDDNKDRGVEFRYFDSQARLGFFGFDDSSNEFIFLTGATNTNEIYSGTDGTLRAGSIRVTGASGTTFTVDSNATITGTTTSTRYISTTTTAAPLTVNSTTKVTNLNADLLDGLDTSSSDTTGNSVVSRSSGNFSANIITVATGTGAGAGIQGNALTADTLKTARTITVAGVVDGSVSFNGSSNVTITTVFNDADITALAAMAGTGIVTRTAANTYAQRTIVASPSTGSGITVTNGDGIAGNPTINILSSSSNSANNLVIRGSSGEFSAGAITATSLTSSGALSVTGITTLTGVLNANGGIAVDGTRFTVADTTGNTSIAGTLGVTGATTLSSTLGVTGATTLSSTLGVTGATTLSSTLGVTGVTTLAGVLNANGGIAVDGTAFTVADTTGNTSITGTLAVTGTSTFTGALTASGGVVGNSSTATTLATARTIAISGDGTGTATSFNGSANITIPFTLATQTGLTAGAYTKVTVSTKGLVTAATQAVTTDIAEGTNLYYTDARADARIALQTGANLNLAQKTTTNLAEGTNLYYTNARADARVALQTGTNLDLSQKTTTNLTEGTNQYYTNARADARVALQTGANLNLAQKTTTNLAEGNNLYYTQARFDTAFGNKTTTSLTEGTNLYYTEARVQSKLDDAFAQLQAMLDNLSTATTLMLNLSGDPTPGVVLALGGLIDNGGGGFVSAGTNVATTSSTGTGLTVNTTVSGGVITGVAINQAGSGYLIGDVITIQNPNEGGVLAFDFTNLVPGNGYVTATGVPTAPIGATAGTGLTVNITAINGSVANVTIANPGTGYQPGDTILINQVGSDQDATIDIATIMTNAEFTLADIRTMEIGATLTGATSGTTGTISALGATNVLLTAVDGFFKIGETVGANDVTTLTITSFS